MLVAVLVSSELDIKQCTARWTAKPTK